VEERKKEAFSREYDSYVQTLTRHMNEELWQETTLLHDSEVTTSSFFDVYTQYYIS
jgi:foldase protein PrsA